MMKETANIWEHKVGINGIIANFVFLWKRRIWHLFVTESKRCWEMFSNM